MREWKEKFIKPGQNSKAILQNLKIIGIEYIWDLIELIQKPTLKSGKKMVEWKWKCYYKKNKTKMWNS